MKYIYGSICVLIVGFWTYALLNTEQGRILMGLVVLALLIAGAYELLFKKLFQH